MPGEGIANERYSTSHTEDDPSGFSHFINMIFFHSQLINPPMNYATCMLQFVGSISGKFCITPFSSMNSEVKSGNFVDGIILHNKKFEMRNTQSHRTQSKPHSDTHSKKQPFTNLPMHHRHKQLCTYRQTCSACSHAQLTSNTFVWN